MVTIMTTKSEKICLASEARYISKGPFMFEEITDIGRIFNKVGEDAYIIKPLDTNESGDCNISLKMYQLMKKLCMPFAIILINHKCKKQIGFIVPYESEDFTNDDIRDSLELFEKQKLLDKKLSITEYMKNADEIGSICGYRVARGPIQEKQMRINGEMIIEGK